MFDSHVIILVLVISLYITTGSYNIVVVLRLHYTKIDIFFIKFFFNQFLFYYNILDTKVKKKYSDMMYH